MFASHLFPNPLFQPFLSDLRTMDTRREHGTALFAEQRNRQGHSRPCGINGASLARWQAWTRDRASAAEISPNFSRTFSVYVPFMRGHVLKSRPPFLSAYSIDSAVWTHDAKHACRDGHRYRPVAEGGGSFFRDELFTCERGGRDGRKSGGAVEMVVGSHRRVRGRSRG